MGFVIRVAIGVALYFLIRPKPGARSSVANTGRLWLAWSILLMAFAYYPHNMGLANEIAARLVGLVVIGAIAFTIGAVVGWSRSRRAQTPSSALVEYPKTITTSPTKKISNSEISCTPTATLQLDVDEDQIYALIASELESGTQDKGLWTRLFVQCDGDEKQTKVLYIKQRAERLIAVKRLHLEQAACESAAETAKIEDEQCRREAESQQLDETESYQYRERVASKAAYASTDHGSVNNAHMGSSEVGKGEAADLELAYKRFTRAWPILAVIVGLIVLLLLFGVSGQ